MGKLFTIFFLFISFVLSKDKIAVLPFTNADGDQTKYIWAYNLQDSLYKSLQIKNNELDAFELIPIDEIELTLTEMNIDPSNPQYKSDMWKACKQLGAKYVVTGNYNFESDRYLIDAYIYNVRMRLPLPNYKAEDIFKSETQIYESIQIITDALLPGLLPKDK